LVSRVRNAMLAVAAEFPGAWVESKTLGVSLHSRGVAPKQVHALDARARASMRPFGKRVTLIDGPSVLEANAALGWNKGTAVRRIVRHVSPRDCEVLYAGDSTQDRDAFRVVTALGGVAIGVGRTAPVGATLRLRSPKSVGAFLTRLAAAIGEEGRRR
jgi:trehalose 6-phosphate phosphatase